MADELPVESSEPLVIDVPRNGSVAGDKAPPAEHKEPASATDPGTVETHEPDKAEEPKAGEEPSEPQDKDKPRRDYRKDFYLQQGKHEAEKAEFQRRLDELSKAQPKTADATPKAAVDPNDPRPVWDPEKYAEGGYEDFIADTARWGARQERKAERAQEAAQRAQQATQDSAKAFMDKVTKAGIPDFMDVVQDAPAKFASPHHLEFIDAISESDLAPQIVYHFAKNPDEVRRIDALPLRAQLKELGKLEDKLSSQAQDKKPGAVASKAPPPIVPVKATNGSSKKSLEELATGDPADFQAAAGITVHRGVFTRR
jgi:hypothetical protein